MSARRMVRGWTLLWALLQFALPTAATYADVAVERASAGARVSHVETDGGTGCPAAHPDDCALCHLAQRFATPGGAPAGPLASATAAHGCVASSPAGLSAERGRLPLSRAPPVV